MHEMSIAQSLIDIVRDEMSRHDAKRLRSVHLRIGQMSTVVPEALSFCFEVITGGTELEGAHLVMEVVPLKGICRACGREFEIEDYAFICPECGGLEIEPRGGQDLSVVELEVD